MGQGPMTGRGAGYCAGYGVPGYANPWGGAFGGARGGGRGRGWRHGYLFRAIQAVAAEAGGVVGATGTTPRAFPEGREAAGCMERGLLLRCTLAPHRP